MNRYLQQKYDHPGYSYERAPWALVTGVEPFQLISGNRISQYTSLVNLPVLLCQHRILADKKAEPSADTMAWEQEIDERVYQLYGLTKAEIAIVEGESA